MTFKREQIYFNYLWICKSCEPRTSFSGNFQSSVPLICGKYVLTGLIISCNLLSISFFLAVKSVEEQSYWSNADEQASIPKDIACQWGESNLTTSEDENEMTLIRNANLKGEARIPRCLNKTIP